MKITFNQKENLYLSDTKIKIRNNRISEEHFEQVESILDFIPSRIQYIGKRKSLFKYKISGNSRQLRMVF